jgi:hypothetical protein
MNNTDVTEQMTAQLEAMISLKAGMETINQILDLAAEKIKAAYPIDEVGTGFMRGAVVGHMKGMQAILNVILEQTESTVEEQLDELLPDAEEIIDEEEEDIENCANCVHTDCPDHPEYQGGVILLGPSSLEL